MTISQQEFEALDPLKHVVVDAQGRMWFVRLNLPNNAKRVPGSREITLARNIGEERLCGWENDAIVDAHLGGIDVELNHPSAFVRLQTAD